MPVVPIRLSDVPLYKRLRESATRRQVDISTLAERLIDEGSRMEAHPGVMFQEGPTGRRAVLAGGPEVADVIALMIRGDVPVKDRRTRTSELMGLSLPTVDAALAYYADHTEEVDTEIAARDRAASEAEAAWRR
ncbi:MAG: hypothetical protein OXH61_03485 [Acidimicrobiaceae bacterium]|nr:hypothetical protein [Acidimicrobiaceae bacterium]